MVIHDPYHLIVNLDELLAKDDSDRKGIELCLDGFSNNSCSNCSVGIIVLDAFFDYFIENLKERKISKKVIGGYTHIHNSQLSVHCCYNESYLYD